MILILNPIFQIISGQLSCKLFPATCEPGKKDPLALQYTGCLIGSLIMCFDSPEKLKVCSIIPSIPQKDLRFAHCSSRHSHRCFHPSENPPKPKNFKLRTWDFERVGCPHRAIGTAHWRVPRDVSNSPRVDFAAPDGRVA